MPTIPFSLCLPPLLSYFQEIRGALWAWVSLSPALHQLLRGSVPGLPLMLRGHPVIQLGALSREHLIMPYLGLVMTAPCHCALLSCPEPFVGRKLICLTQIGCSYAQPFSKGLRSESSLAESVALGDCEGSFHPAPLFATGSLAWDYSRRG